MEVIDAGYGLMAEGYDYVAFAEAGFVGGAGRFGGEDDHSGFFGEIVEADDPAMERNGLGFDSDESPANAAALQEAASDEFCGVDADGEAEALGAHDGGGVDADHAAVGRNQRAARIAGVEGGVGLDYIVDHAAGVGTQGAAEGADDSGGDGVLESVGIADGDGELADAERLGVAESDGGEAGSVIVEAVEADYGEVGGGVVPDEVCGAVAAVGERDFDSRGVVDDVAVGQDEAVGGEDESGAAAVAVVFASDFNFCDRGADFFRGGDYGAGVGVEERGVGAGGADGAGGVFK